MSSSSLLHEEFSKVSVEGEGGVLSTKSILEARERGAIVIEPFVESHVTSCAYDIRIFGGFWFKEKQLKPIYASCFSGDKQSVASTWELTSQLEYLKMKYEGELAPFIVVPPNGSILAASLEFIGSTGQEQITTLLRARSSVCRAGLTISASGGWGDVGFVNRWGMLIHNTRNVSVCIAPGERVAQIVFLTVTPSRQGDDYVSRGGSYNPKSIETMESEFSPSSILPGYEK